MHDGGTVVQTVARHERYADEHEHVPPARGLQDLPQCFECGILQRILQEQVAAGIARRAKLRRGQQHDVVAPGPFDERDDLARVVPAVGHAHLRRGDRHLQKPVSHRFLRPVPPTNGRCTAKSNLLYIIFYALFRVPSMQRGRNRKLE